MSVEFAVRGLPIAQGALVRSPSGGLYHGHRSQLLAWRNSLATEARAEMGDAPLIEDAVLVSVSFVLPRPKSHWHPVTKTRLHRQLRADAPFWVPKSPDIDKLLRALLDALTLVVWRDDAQVACLTASKEYEGDRVVGARVRIDALPVTQ